MPAKRVAILGGGKIAQYLIERIQSEPISEIRLAFVACRQPSRLPKMNCPVYDSLEDLPYSEAHLVVEAAHADWVGECAAVVLETSDFMPLSLTALANAELEKQCLDTVDEYGHNLYVPEGAVTGLTSLIANRDNWAEVTISMRKNPRNIDMSRADFNAEQITKPTELFRGSTREACLLFPRNVNSHAAVALAGIGFDRTTSVLIADPTIDTSDVEILAISPDIRLQINRSNAISGVSGELTLKSAYQSMLRALKLGSSVELC